jgi:hypothetical protein
MILIIRTRDRCTRDDRQQSLPVGNVVGGYLPVGNVVGGYQGRSKPPAPDAAPGSPSREPLYEIAGGGAGATQQRLLPR